ncbi:MAG: glucose-1-phosphate adenylyltransferase [Desulfobulbaceae bacterium]|jgi:glucose-1-phosphate adenylyltransferase|nr:glucose-1-phosphate adenylyltransferase [Desulfobulbaceae bacterium]
MKIHEQPLVLILAGGVGSRLNTLVHTRAKPAVPFGGIYRIIDFSLSNVMNSGMTHVGVLTQYKPLSLMHHLGTGEPWDFTGRTRGIKILPPRTGSLDSDWYKGTADAVRQNIDFIKSHPSKEVIILSGDHIYRMDIDDMLHFHHRKKADITIAMMVVPKEDIHQFGTGITDKDGRIIEWEEKPKVPRTNLASMGIYVFDTEYLLNLLEEDRKEADFGMHLIPKAIARDDVFAYPFHDYWRDVGTIQSYWQANMDLLNEDSGIAPESWGIRPNVDSSNTGFADFPPARFLPGCKCRKSMISAGCIIEGEVYNSVLAPGVRVGKGAIVRDSILLHNVVVGEQSRVDLAVIDKRCHISAESIVGYGDDKSTVNADFPTHLYTGITLIGKNSHIPGGYTIGRNCIVNTGASIDDFPENELKSGETVHTSENNF